MAADLLRLITWTPCVTCIPIAFLYSEENKIPFLTNVNKPVWINFFIFTFLSQSILFIYGWLFIKCAISCHTSYLFQWKPAVIWLMDTIIGVTCVCSDACGNVHCWANATLSWFGLSNSLVINRARVNIWPGLLCQSPGTGWCRMFSQLIQLSLNHN